MGTKGRKGQKGQKEQKGQKGNGKFKILLLLKLLKFPKLSGNKKATREKGGAPPRSWVLKKIPVKKAAPLS